MEIKNWWSVHTATLEEALRIAEAHGAEDGMAFLLSKIDPDEPDINNINEEADNG